MLKQNIELKRLEIEELQDALVKLDFENKMLLNSLNRKIEYYYKKYEICATGLEKDNILDIIEKAKFESTMSERETNREKIKVLIKIEQLTPVLEDLKKEASRLDQIQESLFE